MEPRVLVAMSGGVDSSVAALLLKQRGDDVLGVTLNLWSYEGRQEPYNECCSLEVRTVAQQLGIEHHFVDAGTRFFAMVVEPFARDYAHGRTPSPCGRCNRHVRFPVLFELAREWGCAYLVTGHHARVEFENGTYYLQQGVDALKDQSYFLYALKQTDLRQLLLPIGHYKKSQIWEMARTHNLISARKPESQDLCFLPRGDYPAYLRSRLNGAVRPGPIVDATGRVLGQHDGLAFYTVGQRRGLGIAVGERYYVVQIDARANRVVVGPEEQLYAAGLTCGETSFVCGSTPEERKSVSVKIRYRAAPVPATIEPLPDGKVGVAFAQPQRAVTPGQLAVFYAGDRVLGGGIIESAVPVTGSQTV